MVSIVIQLFKKTNHVILFSYIISIFIYAISYYAGYSMNTEYVQDDTPYSVINIFINNTIISIIMFLGILSLGLINLGFAIVNGFSIGSLIQFSVDNMKVNDIIWNLFPHGIFEIPSIIISTSVGFIPILLIVQRAHKKIKINYIFYMKYIGVLFLIVLILNIIAALLEVVITMSS